MLVPDDGVKIFVCVEPIDMRKCENGLIDEIKLTHKDNPKSGHVYIFINESSTIIKALFWDSDGFVIFKKRLEIGEFSFPVPKKGKKMKIDKEQLDLIFSGKQTKMIN